MTRIEGLQNKAPKPVSLKLRARYQGCTAHIHLNHLGSLSRECEKGRGGAGREMHMVGTGGHSGSYFVIISFVFQVVFGSS